MCGYDVHFKVILLIFITLMLYILYLFIATTMQDDWHVLIILVYCCIVSVNPFMQHSLQSLLQ